MTDDAAFLAAIAAQPGDDLPRRIYADWLDERGRAGLAFAYRWAADNRKSPAPPHGVVTWWQWYFEGRADFAYLSRRHILPSALDCTPMSQGRWQHTRYDTFEGAMQSLADGLDRLKTILGAP